MTEPQQPLKPAPSEVTQITSAKGARTGRAAGGRPKGHSADRAIVIAERRAKVLELRKMQVPYLEIGRLLGVSNFTAHEDMQAILAEMSKAALEDYRREVAQSTEWLINRAAVLVQWATVMEDGFPRDGDLAVKAMGQMRGALSNYASLLGLNMPVQVDVSSSKHAVSEFDKDVMENLARIDEARARRAAKPCSRDSAEVRTSAERRVSEKASTNRLQDGGSGAV